MLAIEKCRALIPDGNKLTEEEIMKIRESLYNLAKLALEMYFRQQRNKSNR